MTTALTWDILYGDGVVISAAQNGETTNYTYGLERISAITGRTRTEYVYDGRGSVAAEVSYNNAWYTFGGGLARKTVTAKSYTPFGEQIGEATSGFGYNGEYYNAATGMIYLRARFYAPEMNRFGQKDILRGSAINSTSINRYAYCINDPLNFCDPSGESLKTLWNSAKNFVSAVSNTVNTVKTVINTTVSSAAKTVVSTAAKTVASAKATVQATKSAVVTSVASSLKKGDTLKQTITNAVQAGATTFRTGAIATATIATSGAKSVQQTVSTGIEAVKATAAYGWEKTKRAGAELWHQAGTAFGNSLLAIEQFISYRYPYLEHDEKMIEDNYAYNSNIVIPNGELNNQINGPEGTLIMGYPGMKPKLLEFVWNYPYTSDTGCEAIAVKNALKIGPGIDVPLADVIKQFEELNAVTWAPGVRYGELGSNPYSIGDVLSLNGVSYKRIHSIENMNEEGTYIMSFWNPDVNGLPTFTNGVHTIAISFDGTSYQPFNYSEVGPDDLMSIQTFNKLFEDSFVYAYRVD